MQFILIPIMRREVNNALLEEKYDFIFFTGSSSLGKIVMTKAAEHLTPVCLELGGKSPCIIDRDAAPDLSAKRCAWGKLINAGQTCISPDYIYIHKEIKEKFIASYIKYVQKFYPGEIESNPEFPRIINEKSFNRIQAYLSGEEILYGGKNNKESRFIAPTLVNNPDPGSPLVQDEIFGPIMPLIDFTEIDEVIKSLAEKEKPLALYYFGASPRNRNKVIKLTSSGAVCVNDTLMHFPNAHLPFGGVGNSGMGAYHGKQSFNTFSHMKAVMQRGTFFDIPVRYAPFKGKLPFLKKLLG